MMDNFITTDYLSTFVGMVAVVVLITQFTKDLVDKVAKWLPTKYLVFLYSLVVMIGYQVMTGTFKASQLLLTVINSILITMTAQGGYEWVFKPIEQKSTKES
jgi:hypothetical protein